MKMEIEMFLWILIVWKVKELENLQEFEDHKKLENQDLERSLEFEILGLDFDFESLKIENFG